MTETIESAAAPKRRGLTAMRLAELQEMAAGMGISGTAKMRKGDLIAAIKGEPSGPAGSGAGVRSTAAPAVRAAAGAAATENAAPAQADRAGADSAPSQASATSTRGTRRSAGRRAGAPVGAPAGQDAERAQRDSTDRQTQPARAAVDGSAPDERDDRRDASGDAAGQRERHTERADRQRDNREDGRREQRDRRQQGEGRDNRQQGEGRDNRQQGEGRDNRQQGEGRDNRQQGERDQSQNRDGRRGNREFRDDDERGGRRRNRQRNRDRKRRGGRGDDYQQNDAPESISDDDVIVPVAGILELLDNYAFVRTSGYLPGPNDVYVPLGFVKKHGLRKGDAVTGAVRALREGEQLPPRQKFNALVRLDTINGTAVDEVKPRVEFNKLTPLYPQQRLRLETEPNVLTTRIIDLVSPIGKGQRGLIVAPAKAGKTMVMQALANAISKNNPECHLMVVLVDERPEEVTDMQRAVKGEVISSTFDRPATDHTTVAELAIERAKRLVELGHDVVVLLDSITKLGRAYNLAAPASGRILSGGVDSAALYPPKRFFGAARNIEHGGSLTILATALVETGSKMDEVIFEEFKGTGNMELKLDRGLANRRIFPAVDVNNSGTRREEILLASDELKIMWKLRRVLAALDQQQGIELLIDRLKKSKSNTEFLMTVQKTSNIKLDDED